MPKAIRDPLNNPESVEIENRDSHMLSLSTSSVGSNTFQHTARFCICNVLIKVIETSAMDAYILA